MCRDFAHLAIALCRAVGIPARYISAYAWQLLPPDFHAVFEAYLHGPAGGAWYLFDPTRMAALDGLVRIGAGRDAADVAFCSIFGDAESAAAPGLDQGAAARSDAHHQAVSNGSRLSLAETHYMHHLALAAAAAGLPRRDRPRFDRHVPAGLPRHRGELRRAGGTAQVTLASWFAGLAVGQITQGTLADRFGRRGPLMAGLALYTLACVGCALAPNLPLLTAMRALAAFGGSASMVLPRAVVRDLADGHAAAG